MAITTNKNVLQGLGLEIKTKLTQFKSDRKTLEQQLLKNLRQYRGKYDPEVESVLNSTEYATRSKVYPRDTRVKVTGFVAKMMEMMFPATENNWAIEPTEFPNLSEADLDKIIATLETQKLAEFQQSKSTPNPLPQPTPITSAEIEAQVKILAKKKAAAMESEILDQLQDIGGDKIEYPQLCKRVLRSAAIYGFGVAEGPLVRDQLERVWEPNAAGKYVSKTSKTPRPYYEAVKVWDMFPDLTAKTWRGQSGIFRRRIFLKNDFLSLGGREDFFKDDIEAFVKENPDGNYSAMDYESELDTVNNTTNIDKSKKGKFEVFRFLGYVSGQTLSDLGVEIKESEKIRDVLGDIWIAGDKVIKADIASFGDNPADSYHIFIYEDDEESGLTGMGLPEVLRDTQMRLCVVDRATMDNLASVAGPIFEINEALVGKSQDTGSIHSFTVIHRDDDNPATVGVPALKQVSTDSHISEFLAVREVIKQILDFESNLPSIMMGDPNGVGEAFRTSGNMSMLTGAGNMVTKDIVRAFDRFTTSFIGSMLLWNMEFNTKEEIKGDFQAAAKGSRSLVAKEVRGAALDQLWQTMDEEDRAITKRREVLLERFKSRDLPTDFVEDEETSKKILSARAQAMAQRQQIESGLTQSKTAKNESGAQKEQAQAQEILATLQSKIASLNASVGAQISAAKTAKEKSQLEHIKVLLDSITAEKETKAPAKKAAGK